MSGIGVDATAATVVPPATATSAADTVTVHHPHRPHRRVAVRAAAPARVEIAGAAAAASAIAAALSAITRAGSDPLAATSGQMEQIVLSDVRAAAILQLGGGPAVAVGRPTAGAPTAAAQME